MKPFRTLRGVAAPLPMANIDTDMIIPKEHLKTTERTGLGKVLFDELRFREDGSPNPDFILNTAPYDEANILVAWDNFGCGSSREHAPWALADFGITAVIAPSFADIFFNNCFQNGILPIPLPTEEVERIMRLIENPQAATLSIDLESQTITLPDGGRVGFEIDPFRKQCLLEGLDNIGLTLAKADAIDAFEAKQRAEQPWLWADAS